jgi:spore germination protein GerM
MPPARGHRLPRRIRAGAVAMLASLALAACTVPSDGEARAIDPARLDAASSNKRNCTSAGVDVESVTVRVYLVSTKEKDAPPSVSPVDRILPAREKTPREALDALFTCKVTAEESRDGLATSVPEETQLLDLVQIPGTDGLYEVRLGPLQNRGSKQVDDLDKLAVAQIFFTATAPGLTAEVKGLRFSIDGRAKAVSTDERTVSQTDFVRRTDFKSSSPLDPSGTRTTITNVVPSTASTSTTR